MSAIKQRAIILTSQANTTTNNDKKEQQEKTTYRNKTAWFSDRCPNRSSALSARSSAAAAAHPSLVPSPLLEVEKVLRAMKPCEERRVMGRPTWKRLAKWEVAWLSDCRWLGNEGNDGCVWAPPSFPPMGGRLRAMMATALLSEAGRDQG